MALKGKPVAIGNVSTTIYTCPSGTEAAVHGLIFSNNTAGALAVDVIVYNQADNTTTTVATDLNVPGNSFITWTKPVNLNAGDTISAASSAASGLVCLFSVYEGSAAPVAIGFTGRGIWDSGSTYAVNDIATVTGSGTYLALQPSTNQDPTTETAFWMFLEGISASALPVQTSQAGKFLTTDGSNASWAEVDVAGGAEITNPMSSNVTLSAANKRVQVFYPTASRNVTLPAASTLTLGESFVIANKGAFSISVFNNAGALLTVVSSGKANKFLLVNTATSDWEAFAVELAGEIAALATGPTQAFSDNGDFAGVAFTKLSTNTYQTWQARVYGSLWGLGSSIFTLDANNNFNSIRTGEEFVTYRYGSTGQDNQNATTVIGDGLCLFGGYEEATDTRGQVHLLEMTASTALTHRHTHTSAVLVGRAPPVARLDNRKAIVFYSNHSNNTNALNIVGIVYNYTSSLTAPTIGTATNFASGGTHNPRLCDAEQLDTDKCLLMYNAATGTSGDIYEKRIVVCTVSGTTPTFHTPLVLTPSRFDSATVRLRVLSATKAVASWREGALVVARIINISGNTLTAGTKFTLTDSPFSNGSTTTIRGANDSEFYVMTQNTADNGCNYISKFAISGDAYVSNTAYAKISPALAKLKNTAAAGLIDTEKASSFVTVFPGQPQLHYAVATPTSI
jgi:hypothetical protein